MPELTRALAGQTALVTGASSGIGRAIGLHLGGLGARVRLVARRLDRLQELAREIQDRGGVAIAQAADLTRADDLQSLSRSLNSESASLDVLVLSSGTIGHGAVSTAPLAELDKQLDANLRAPYALIQAVLPLLRRRRGQIVFINSSAGLKPPAAGAGQFAITQYGYRALADALREEVNPDGIRVLSIYPGRTATPRTASLFEAEGRAYRSDVLMQPEDIASVVGHVLSLPQTAEVTDISMRPMLKSY